MLEIAFAFACISLITAIVVLLIKQLRILRRIEARPDPPAAEPRVILQPQEPSAYHAMPGVLRGLCTIIKRLDEPIEVHNLKTWQR